MTAPGVKPKALPAPTTPLEERLVRAVDPTGETQKMLQAAKFVMRVPGAKWLLRNRGVDVDALTGSIEGFEGAQRTVAAAIRAFAPLGWAPSGAMPLDGYAAALEALVADGQDAAEQVLVAAWDDGNRLNRPVWQMGILGQPEREYHNLFSSRSELLGKAYAHHRSGAYEASVPIVLAQVEGFVADVTGGKLFFTRRPDKAADVLDDTAIVSLHEALPVVRDYFSKGMDHTADEGSLSRHGILHGRELGYGTYINSVKAFVLLQALVEWAQPRVRAEVDRLKAEREAAWAGSDEVDERGRRRDDREFSATRDALRHLHICQMGHHRNQGHFNAGLMPVVEAQFPKNGLPADHGVIMYVSDDEQSWWAWRRTVSGWCFGIGATALDSQWCYDGAQPPAAGPAEAAEFWREQQQGHGILPNWKSR